VPNVTLELEVITAALREQLARDADTTVVIESLVALSRVIMQRAPNANVCSIASDLRVQTLKLSQATDVPRFVVRDMLDDAIQRLESPFQRPRV